MVTNPSTGRRVFGKEARKIEDARRQVTAQRALDRDIKNQTTFQVTQRDSTGKVTGTIFRTTAKTALGNIRVDSVGSASRISAPMISGQQKVQAISGGDIKRFTVTSGGVRRNVLAEKQIQFQRQRALQEKDKKPLTLVTNISSGALFTGLVGRKPDIPRKQEGIIVPFQRIISVPEIRSLGEKFSRNGDIDTAKEIVELQKKGKFTVAKKNEFEIKLKKQDDAIKKIDAINKKTQEFNDNYNRSVKPILDFLIPDKITLPKLSAEVKSGVLQLTDVSKEKIKFVDKANEKRFSREVGRYVLREGSKFANPFIIGTEIASFLESFRVAKEAGLTSIPKQARKLKDPEKLLKNFTEFTKASFNPNTVNGLGNIIIGITILGLPRLIIKGLAKGTGGVLRGVVKGTGIIVKGSVKGVPAFINELRLTLKALAKSKSASLRGVRRIRGRPSKVEIGKRNLARQANSLTRQQQKGFARTKAETKRQRRSAKIDAQRQKGVGKPIIIISEKAKEVTRVKLQPIKNIKSNANQLLIFDRQGKIILDIKKKFGRITGAEIAKPVVNAHKGIGSSVSNQINLTIQKQSKRARRRAIAKSKGKKLSSVERKALIKQEAKIKSQKKSGGQIEKKVNDRLESTFVNNKNPQASVIYEDLIVAPPEVLTKGWRSSSIKNQVISRLDKAQKILKAQRVAVVKKAILKLRRSKVAKQVWKTRKEVQKRTVVIIRQLLNPKLDLNAVFKSLTDVRIAVFLGDALKIISLLSLSFEIVSKLKEDVIAIRVAKERSVLVSKALIISKSRIRTRKAPVKKRPTRKAPVRKPVKKVPIKKALVKKRPVRKIIKKIPIKRRVLFKFPLKRRKKVVKVIKSLLSSIPKKFRPSLKAVVLGITASKIPKIITGLEVRPIIIKLAKKMQEEEEKKKKKGK